MRILLFILFVFFVVICFGQKFSERSRYEKRWALFHPFAALKVKQIYKECLPVYNFIKKGPDLDTCENGGKLDAFRHTFFMAAFAQKIKTRKLKKLGIAHEKGNYSRFLKNIVEDGELADSLSNVMDLQNNELGFDIGKNHKEKSLHKLGFWVLSEIKDGRAVYFKRNSSGKYLTCNNEVINLNEYKNKWFIPKCLIPTNF